MTAVGAGAAATPAAPAAASDDASANKTKATAETKKPGEEEASSSSTSTVCPSVARSPTRHVVLVVTGATYVLADDAGNGKEAAFSKKAKAKATDSRRRRLDGMLAVNGSVLGPTLEFEEGEDISVDVVNKVAGNGNDSTTATATSVHWHGLDLQGSAWADGVSGVTQRPVPRGVSFRYRFKAGPVGTHWYHAREYFASLFLFERKGGASSRDTESPDPPK